MDDDRQRSLDFIVIGVQKGGTTSLWAYLRSHPLIAMPNFKEAPIFCQAPERIPVVLDHFMRSAFPDAPPRARLGKSATHYMMGMNRTPVETIAERIARAVPRVRLIALIRDPIDRAISQYRMLVRRGLERRSFDDLVEDLLDPDQLGRGRSQPTKSNTYLVQGEYARILQIYRSLLPAEQIHVESTAALDREPHEVIDRILSFLDLPTGHRPEDLGVRHNVGGTKPRLGFEHEAQLRDFMERRVWPKLGSSADLLRFEFNSFVNLWNVIPDGERPALSSENRRRLEAHYRADGELLSKLGVASPWLAEWIEGTS